MPCLHNGAVNSACTLHALRRVSRQANSIETASLQLSLTGLQTKSQGLANAACEVAMLQVSVTYAEQLLGICRGP